MSMLGELLHRRELLDADASLTQVARQQAIAVVLASASATLLLSGHKSESLLHAQCQWHSPYQLRS